MSISPYPPAADGFLEFKQQQSKGKKIPPPPKKIKTNMFGPSQRKQTTSPGTAVRFRVRHNQSAQTTAVIGEEALWGLAEVSSSIGGCFVLFYFLNVRLNSRSERSIVKEKPTRRRQCSCSSSPTLIQILQPENTSVLRVNMRGNTSRNMITIT